MKVAYVISSDNSRTILRDMIVPQMESKEHGVDVIGMFFVFDNTYLLLNKTELGQRLQKLKDETGMIILACDQCVYKREIEDKMISGADIGCFPVLYGALSSTPPDQIITL